MTLASGVSLPGRCHHDWNEKVFVGAGAKKEANRCFSMDIERFAFFKGGFPFG
jgi:hypothetical protein